MSHRETVERFWDVVWSAGDAEAAARFFAPDATATGLSAEMSLTVEDFVTLAAAMQHVVEPPVTEILKFIELDDWAAALIHMRGAAKKDGKIIDLTGQVMMRFEDGLIAEAHNHFDLVAAFVQLGLLPDNAVERALLGHAA